MASYSGGTKSHGYPANGYSRTEDGVTVKAGAIELTSRSHVTAVTAAKTSVQKDEWLFKNNESEEDVIANQRGIVKNTEYTISEIHVHPGSAFNGGGRNSRGAKGDADSLDEDLNDTRYRSP
jgi:hypothetical protein